MGSPCTWAVAVLGAVLSSCPAGRAAMTADTSDMQGQVNLVWDRLLSGFRDKALPENRAEQEKLRQPLSGLESRAKPARKPVARVGDSPLHEAELVFPLHPKHNHAPSIVESPNGDLL